MLSLDWAACKPGRPILLYIESILVLAGAVRGRRKKVGVCIVYILASSPVVINTNICRALLGLANTQVSRNMYNVYTLGVAYNLPQPGFVPSKNNVICKVICAWGLGY